MTKTGNKKGECLFIIYLADFTCILTSKYVEVETSFTQMNT